MLNLNFQVHNKGPFKESQSIILNETQTLISGDHGFGKSTVAQCIFDQIERYTVYNPEIPIWAILMDEQSNMLRESWFQHKFSGSELFKFRNELKELMTWALNKMLELKIKNRFTKFNSIINEGQTIQASINDDFSFSFKIKQTGRNIDSLFIAHGETTVVTIASVYAVRNLLKVELPIIADTFLAYLDSDLKKSCISFLTQMGTTIIFEHPGFFKDFNLKPHYKIDYDIALGSSLIKNEP